MNNALQSRRNSATSASGLMRNQSRSERRRRTSFWQFFRVEGDFAPRSTLEQTSIEHSTR